MPSRRAWRAVLRLVALAAVTQSCSSQSSLYPDSRVLWSIPLGFSASSPFGSETVVNDVAVDSQANSLSTPLIPLSTAVSFTRACIMV